MTLFSCKSNSVSENNIQTENKIVDTTSVNQQTSPVINYQWFLNDEYLTGLKDGNGNILVEAQFNCVGNFYNGWAAVSSDEFNGFCDTLGNLESLPPGIIFATIYSDMGGGYFFEGRSENIYVVQEETSMSYGYVHCNKELIVSPKYDAVYEFSEGYAVVSLYSKYGFIDTNGIEVITPQYLDAKAFSEGYAGVKDSSGLYGFINYKNTMVVNPTFYNVTAFQGDLCIVNLSSDGLISFIDKKGKVVIEGPFEEAHPFWNETTLVRKDGKCYYINKKGKKTENSDCTGFEGC